MVLRVYRNRLEAVRSRAASRLTPLAEADPESAALAAHRLMDDEKAAAHGRSREAAPACAEGCSFCCHVHVDVTRPELVAIASHLRGAYPESELEAFRHRLERHAARTEPLTDEARWTARIPCALLDEQGRCSVYLVRPLRCRAFHSTTTASCRRAFDGAADAEPALNPTVARILDAVEAGYEDALAAARLSQRPERLESGLLALLAGPSSAKSQGD